MLRVVLPLNYVPGSVRGRVDDVTNDGELK